MTQPDLADRASVSLAYVYMLESGGLSRLELEPLLRIAEALGYSRLVKLLQEVHALSNGARLVPSVEELAVADAVRRFLGELRDGVAQ